jgi:hypothetical protein
MNALLTLGLITAVFAFGGLTVLFLDARTKHFDRSRARIR